MTKRCTKCGEEKDLSEFAKNSRGKDGLRSYCKKCGCEQYRLYRVSHKEEVKEQGRHWYATNKERVSERRRPWRVAHKEETRLWRAAHSAEIGEQKRIYYEAHKDQINARQVAWNKAHPETNRNTKHKRRACKANAGGAEYTTTAMVKARWDVWGNQCYICGDPAEQTDHVKPLIKGGAHLPCNLRPICRRCNRSKNAKWPYEPAMNLERLP